MFGENEDGREEVDGDFDLDPTRGGVVDGVVKALDHFLPIDEIRGELENGS